MKCAKIVEALDCLIGRLELKKREHDSLQGYPALTDYRFKIRVNDLSRNTLGVAVQD